MQRGAPRGSPPLARTSSSPTNVRPSNPYEALTSHEAIGRGVLPMDVEPSMDRSNDPPCCARCNRTTRSSLLSSRPSCLSFAIEITAGGGGGWEGGEQGTETATGHPIPQRVFIRSPVFVSLFMKSREQEHGREKGGGRGRKKKRERRER